MPLRTSVSEIAAALRSVDGNARAGYPARARRREHQHGICDFFGPAQAPARKFVGDEVFFEGRILPEDRLPDPAGINDRARCHGVDANLMLTKLARQHLGERDERRFGCVVADGATRLAPVDGTDVDYRARAALAHLGRAEAG